MYLGYTVLTEERVKAAKKKLQPKERPGEKYEVSRWTPVLQDIAEVALLYMVCGVCVLWAYCISMQLWMVWMKAIVHGFATNHALPLVLL